MCQFMCIIVLVLLPGFVLPPFGSLYTTHARTHCTATLPFFHTFAYTTRARALDAAPHAAFCAKKKKKAARPHRAAGLYARAATRTRTAHIHVRVPRRYRQRYQTAPLTRDGRRAARAERTSGDALSRPLARCVAACQHARRFRNNTSLTAPARISSPYVARYVLYSETSSCLVCTLTMPMPLFPCRSSARSTYRRFWF